MAYFFTTSRQLVRNRMAAGNELVSSKLLHARYAKTTNKYFIAWVTPREIAVLPPDHPKNTECNWLEGSQSIEEAIEFIESGHYAKGLSFSLNMSALDEKSRDSLLKEKRLADALEELTGLFLSTPINHADEPSKAELDIERKKYERIKAIVNENGLKSEEFGGMFDAQKTADLFLRLEEKAFKFIKAPYLMAQTTKPVEAGELLKHHLFDHKNLVKNIGITRTEIAVDAAKSAVAASKLEVAASGGAAQKAKGERCKQKTIQLFEKFIDGSGKDRAKYLEDCLQDVNEITKQVLDFAYTTDNLRHYISSGTTQPKKWIIAYLKSRDEYPSPKKKEESLTNRATNAI